MAPPPTGRPAPRARPRHLAGGAPDRTGRISRRVLLRRTVLGAVAAVGVAGATWSATRHRQATTSAADDHKHDDQNHDDQNHDATRASGSTGTDARKTGSGASKALLAGKIVGIDPGHNGDNWEHTSYIDQIVWNGREDEACDTTGTQEPSGYTEAQFAFNVAEYLATMLRAQGATVILTRTTNAGYGPCITDRASIVNNADADVCVSIHADGGPVDGRGFSILEPVASGVNDAVVGSSQALGVLVRSAFVAETPMPVSDYYGVNGVVPRDDLGGLNLTTVPKVMVECGNMPNPTDAALLVDPGFQQQVATAFAKAITTFLTDPSQVRTAAATATSDT